jgi:hypothetical protein
MFDAELDGKAVVMVVAQHPFEADSAGVRNAFSLLKPVLHEDGRVAEDEEFPGNGYVWWMLRPGTRGFAEPGRLLTGVLEPSRQVRTPGKAWYQVKVDSVEPVKPGELVEIVTASPGWANEPRDIVARDRPLLLDHPPMEQVYVAWEGHLYGPLRASTDHVEDGAWRVHFSTVNPDHSVLKIPESAVAPIAVTRQHHLRAEVSLTDIAPDRIAGTHECRYHLISAREFQQASAGVPRVILEDDAAVIKRAAKKVFTRTKRQQLTSLLDELLGTLDTGAETGAAESARVIEALRGRLEVIQGASDEIAQALLESGALGARLDEALVRAEQAHVEQNAARLQTQIDERVQHVRFALDAIEKERDARKQELESQYQKKRATLEAELEKTRQDFDRGCRQKEEHLQEQLNDLTRQRELISNSLAEVGKLMTERRQEMINQFLAIAPLLQQLHLFPAGVAADANHAALPAPALNGETAAPAPAGKAFDIPAFVSGGAPAGSVSETQFFDRFCKHVDASGFKYRQMDLAGFHLSAKCNDLTILGGLPGTGKSSLPRLYAEALAGDEYQDDLPRYLHVGVSPSWLDMRDLLGQANALDRCFQPAESGLYPLLIWAQEEEARRGLDSRLYVICLDEMNLAQVEHYFSGFLQALERPPGQREVRCFAPELVAPTDPFARWPVLKLPRSLRFVGTVNFDETTRQLSQRVLDRADLIRLRPSYLLDAREPGTAKPSGPPVALRQFRDWVTPSASLDRSLGELLDQLRDPLTRLGCPLNPRRFNAVRKFVGSAPASICTPAAALDLQIAQRILPQVRHLFRPAAREALHAIRKTLEGHASGFAESLQLLADLEAHELTSAPFAEGDGE